MFPNAKICIGIEGCAKEGKEVEPSAFYTMKGYELAADTQITTAMEDYLEMIAVWSGKSRPHPDSGSVSATARQALIRLKNGLQPAGKGLVTAEKYGEIHLTDSGRAFGQYLLYRHDLLHQFLCFLNHSQNELEQVEKIEHFVDEKTVRSIQAFLDGLTRESRA